jgi:hypothetical protein
MDATASALPGPETPTTTTITPIPPISTHTSPSAAARFNALTSHVFLTEPLTIILRLEADRPPNNLLLESHILAGYGLRTTRKLADGGVIIEAGNWAAAAIWDPPGSTVSGPPLTEAERARRPVFASFIDDIAAAKKRHMPPGQRYWHLSMMARDPRVQPPVKGAVRAVIEPYLRRAREEGLPVWLEASSTRARDVYAHLGFEVLECVENGMGKYRADGYPAGEGEEAPGVPTWFMIHNRTWSEKEVHGRLNGAV